MNNKSILSKSETDWARLDTMSDEDIDRSDCPEVTPEMFAKAVVRRNPNNLVQQDRSIIENSDTWNNEDMSDLSTFSLQYAATIYADDEELI